MDEKNILIVDDEPCIRETTKDILSYAGFNVTTGNDGFDAVDRVKQGFNGLILMDIKMPRLDGISAFKMIHDINPDVRSLIMTGYATNKNEADAKKMGITILYKPFNIDELFRLINVIDP